MSRQSSLGEFTVRSFYALAIVALVVSVTSAASAAESLEFDGQTLELAYQARENKEAIREFIPRGETLETWTKLAAIRDYADHDDPAAMVAAVVRGIREKYPEAPYKVLVNKKSGDAIVDFLLWPEDESFTEFNVFRYSKGPRGGLVSQQYALRAYGNDTKAFLTGLRPQREKLVTLMSGTGLVVDGVAVVGADGKDPLQAAESSDTTASAWEETETSVASLDGNTGNDDEESIATDLEDDADDDASEDGDGDDAEGDEESDEDDDASEDE